MLAYPIISGILIGTIRKIISHILRQHNKAISETAWLKIAKW